MYLLNGFCLVEETQTQPPEIWGTGISVHTSHPSLTVLFWFGMVFIPSSAFSSPDPNTLPLPVSRPHWGTLTCWGVIGIIWAKQKHREYKASVNQAAGYIQSIFLWQMVQEISLRGRAVRDNSHAGICHCPTALSKGWT